MTLGYSELKSAVGLILGGMLAAPISGFVVSRIPTRPVMLAVGVIIIASTVVNLI